jgi:hypothetical protein
MDAGGGGGLTGGGAGGGVTQPLSAAIEIAASMAQSRRVGTGMESSFERQT